MWWTYRRLFTYIIVCGFIVGSIYFIRLQVNYTIKRPAPDFYPNVARYRTSRVCSNRALVLVNSTPSGSRRRQVIRETWGHPTVTQSLDISVAFGVGAADNIDVQRSLDLEAEIYGDIFQNAVVDSEIKCASKVMEILKTTRSACTPLPEFVLKTEDNVFLNSLLLGELLESLETYSSSNTMWCLEWNRKFDKLGTISTWVVPKNSSFHDGHPNYCIGTLYLMTGRAADAIVRRHDAQTSKNMLPEDVYVTGILTKEAGITLSFLGLRFEFDNLEQIDSRKVAFANFADGVEDSTRKIWETFVKSKLNDNRRSDTGL